MSRTYHHLSPEERAVIMIERQNGSSLRSIAHRLGRSPSTLSRELQRAGPEAYDATRAAQGYRERRSASRRPRLMMPGTALYQYVHDRLVFSRWSPQQIVARLRQMPESERPGLISTGRSTRRSTRSRVVRSSGIWSAALRRPNRHAGAGGQRLRPGACAG